MNTEPKVSLTIELSGQTCIRSPEAEKIKIYITKKDINPNKKWPKKEGYKVVKVKEATHYPLKAKPAFLHILINEESYLQMCNESCPYWADKKIWKTFNSTQRLEAHLKRICESHRGINFSYTILGD